jgi:hypothetical protein
MVTEHAQSVGGSGFRHAQADRTKGRTGLTTAEREELVGAIQWGFANLSFRKPV